MSDPRQLVDTYAAKTEWSAESGADISREEEAPKAFAALRAVLDVHGRAGGGLWLAFCEEDEQDWPCPTVQAIISALESP